MDFTDRKLQLKEAVGEIPAVTLNYGSFIQNIVDFVIIAFAIFIAVKAINKMKRTAPPVPAAAPPAQEVLLAEIRDLLKQN